MQTRQLIGLLGLLCWSSLAVAQNDLPSENVTVLNNFEAQLAESERVDLLPTLPQPDTSKSSQTYYVPTKILPVDYPPPKIRPIAMRSEKLQKVYNGYAKAGVGLPNSFYGEGSYRVFLDKKLDLGFGLRHHSANQRSVENQRFMENSVNANGTYYFDQGFAVQGDLQYAANDFYYYAYSLVDSVAENVNVDRLDVRQRYSLFEADFSLFNGSRTVGDFDYDVGANVYTLNDDYASSELGFNIELEATKWIQGQHAFDVVLLTDFTRFSDTAVQNLNNFYLQPAFTYHGDFFKAKIGANVVSHDDEFFVFPDAEVSVNVANNYIIPFIGATGTLQKNTMRTLTEYNPFLNTRLDIANTRFQHYYGGIRGDAKILEYSGQFGYQQADGLALFLPTEPLDTVNFRQRFDVLYDTVTIYNILGTVSADLLDDLTVVGTINQNIYNTTTQEKAWHLPALTVNGTLIYTTMEDQLQVKAELFFENGVPFINSAGEADRLNSLFDISLGAEYFFTDNIGGFLQINNLANNRRERWQGYPTFGLNVLAGVSARF